MDEAVEAPACRGGGQYSKVEETLFMKAVNVYLKKNPGANLLTTDARSRDAIAKFLHNELLKMDPSWKRTIRSLGVHLLNSKDIQALVQAKKIRSPSNYGKKSMMHVDRYRTDFRHAALSKVTGRKRVRMGDEYDINQDDSASSSSNSTTDEGDCAEVTNAADSEDSNPLPNSWADFPYPGMLFEYTGQLDGKPCSVLVIYQPKRTGWHVNVSKQSGNWCIQFDLVLPMDSFVAQFSYPMTSGLSQGWNDRRGTFVFPPQGELPLEETSPIRMERCVDRDSNSPTAFVMVSCDLKYIATDCENHDPESV